MTSLPPGPLGGPLAMMRMMRDPYGTVVRCVRKYGDPFTFKMPLQGPLVISGEPTAVRAIFAADPETFASAAAAAMEPIIGRGSVLMLEGDAHRRARKLLAPPFHGNRMRAYGRLMRDLTLARSAHLAADARFSVQDVAQAISLDVILQAVFGVTEPERMARVDAAVRGWMDAIGPMIVMFSWLRHELGGVGPWAKFQRARRTLRALVDEEIQLRERDGAEREDVLSLMLAARYEDGTAMSHDDVFDQLVTLVAAGHETTMISLAWACYWLHRNPEPLARLRAELDTLGPIAAAEPEALVRLPYLAAVVDETLRLHPIVAVPTRKLAKPFELNGHALPAGVHVGAAASLVHYREDLFPEPERFRPERFLERTFGPAEYFPFGGGARRCLGAAFGTYELKIVLGTLLGTLRLRAADDRPVLPTLRAAGIGPGRAVEMQVIERCSNGAAHPV